VFVWLNGRLIAARDAHVSVLDRGLLHGDGVYDTWRTYGGVPFMVGAHLRRLTAAARALGLPLPGSALSWERRSRLLVARNALGDAGVRLTITRGAAGMNLVPETRARPTILLAARRLPPALEQHRRQGIAAVLLPFARDASPWWGGLKTVGHPSAVLGRLAAARRRAFEGLYVTPEGMVTEATSANLFVVERDAVVTPPRTAGVLPGVTRAVVMALARRAGLRVEQDDIPVRRLRRAREVFLTGSTIEVLPIVMLDDRPVRDGRPGPVARLLQERYAARVAVAVGRGGALRSARKTVTRRPG
jgi:branched-subunit amino acid aminotransferase/4-amino-4-deoxychorismate lyase